MAGPVVDDEKTSTGKGSFCFSKEKRIVYLIHVMGCVVAFLLFLGAAGRKQRKLEERGACGRYQ
jgi:hypothetical protein